MLQEKWAQANHNTDHAFKQVGNNRTALLAGEEASFECHFGMTTKEKMMQQ